MIPESRNSPDPACADRGAGVRPHVRHRRRPWAHTSAAIADRRPLDSRRENRLRLRRTAHPGPGALRLAFRPDLRDGGSCAGRVVSGRGASTAAARRSVAAGPDAVLAARLPGAAVRQLVGFGPVHAGDVQHAHGRSCCCRCWFPFCWCWGPVGNLQAATGGRPHDPPGLREWLLAGLHSRLSKILTNPVVATALFVAGFYGAPQHQQNGNQHRRRSEAAMCMLYLALRLRPTNWWSPIRRPAARTLASPMRRASASARPRRD